ncbi:hypothetical protein BH09ACT7_BH09ACT7_38750 [soil metagenome]
MSSHGLDVLEVAAAVIAEAGNLTSPEKGDYF